MNVKSELNYKNFLKIFKIVVVKLYTLTREEMGVIHIIEQESANG